MHTYATVARFKDYLRDNGSDDLGNDALYLSVLEAASRRVEGFCKRSAYGSGFGPRVGINRYDGDGSDVLFLRDDLLSTPSAFTVASSTGGTGISPTVDTDYFLASFGNYNAPYRRIILHGSPPTFGVGYRTVSITGTWGYSNTTRVTGATIVSGFAASTSATEFVASGSPDLSPGHTLLIGTEAMYLRDLDGTAAVVERGSNGTTAANQADDSAISVYTYPEDVVQGTLAVALRRLKLRDSGADGFYGGGGMPSTQPRETEHGVLWANLRDYVIPQP